ncbi:FMN-binding negative transcriptional regulator [uncultured Erythrobacter sp.]|uniref:FMN-binding negative transcriptional regulator n=1 Tax=uncultured Erythrobacter sp. TaxID=263913 RepID=UPI0026102FA0|nr:FMN-binding negative transcriptional regulator [uncultured Erythrobacter sp.]
MHPNPLFRSEDQDLLDRLVSEVSFGMVFLTTPDGPRVAHAPMLTYGTDDIRFHMARSNALTKHLDGARALITVNGPDGYVSPRWYDNRDTVPTWDYAALELEGTVERLSDDNLETLLHDVITTFEGRIEGEPWLASESSERVWSGLFKGITGFSLKVEERRPTFKLSQKKNPVERARIAAGVEAYGNAGLAHWMREFEA